MTEPTVTRNCHCGNDRFYAHQLTRHDVVVDADGVYQQDIGVYDAEDPYGPFTCTQCGAVYDELEELDPPPEEPIMESGIFSVVESALEQSGYQVLDGDRDSVILCHLTNGAEYELRITEFTN